MEARKIAFGLIAVLLLLCVAGSAYSTRTRIVILDAFCAKVWRQGFHFNG